MNEGTTIVVSYIGYLTQELKATSNMKVTLREDTKMPQDVVRWGITSVLHVDNVPGLNTSRDWEPNNRYVAIPQTEIDATKGSAFELKQNPGY